MNLQRKGVFEYVDKTRKINDKVLLVTNDFQSRSLLNRD